MTRIEEIKERFKAATPGPWRFTWDDSRIVSDYQHANSHLILRSEIVRQYQQSTLVGEGTRFSGMACNTNFIVNAPQDMEYLIARCEELERKLKAHSTCYRCGGSGAVCQSSTYQDGEWTNWNTVECLICSGTGTHWHPWVKDEDGAA